MTTRPRLRLGSHLIPGLLAVALFLVLAAVFLRASLGDGEGFETGVSITASIGYAMFDLAGGQVASEGFLAAFEIVDFVLVAALVGAVMLARREDEGSIASAVRTGGMRQFVESAPTDAETDGGERSDASRTPNDERRSSPGSERPEGSADEDGGDR